jgi:TP901 family phage tail tape measure protein
MTEKFGIEARLTDLVTKNFKNMESVVTGSSKRIEDQLKKTTGAGKGSESQFQKTGAAVKSFAARFGPAAVAVAGLTAVAFKLRQAIGFVQEKTEGFEKTMSTAQAILNPTTEEMDRLSEKAKELGRTTAFSASQSGDAFVELGKLGLTTNQIIEASGDVLNIAAAANVDMAVAATNTAQTLQQFSLPATEATRVTDVMAKSFTISALDMEKFSESMKFAGPVAAQLGFTLEETTASMAQMASQGISGSMAGTALRRIMLELGDASSKAGRMIGVTADDTRTFAERLEDLQSKNLSPGQIKDTFGLLSATAAGILIEGNENVKEFDKSLQGAQSTAKDMAATMLDNVQGATVILKSAQEGLGIAIGEAFGANKQKRIEAYTNVINTATEEVLDHKEGIAEMGRVFNQVFINLAKVAGKSIEGISSFFTEVNLAALGFTKAITTAKLKLTELFGGPKDEIALFKAELGVIEDSISEIQIKKLFGDGAKQELKEFVSGVDKVKGAAPGAALGAGPGGGSEETEERKKILAEIENLRRQSLMRTHEGELQLVQEQKAKLLENDSLNKEQRLIIEEEFSNKIRDIKQARMDEEQAFELMQIRGAEKMKDDALKNEERRQKKLEKLANKKKKDADAEQKREDNFTKMRINNTLMLTDALASSTAQLAGIALKSAKSRKRIAVIMSIVETALATVRAISNSPYPYPANIAAGVATGIQGAAQTAVIAAQPLATGGIVDKPTLALMGEAGPEGVLNAGATARFGAGNINALNSGQTINNNVTHQIAFSPSIQVVGSGDDSRDVVSAIDAEKERFAEWFVTEVVNKNYIPAGVV